MSRTYHEIHSQQGRQRQHIEFPSFERGILPAEPCVGLEENYERTYGQDTLDYAVDRSVEIHPPECLSFSARERDYIDSDEKQHQDAHHRMENSLSLLSCNQVIQKGYD